MCILAVSPTNFTHQSQISFPSQLSCSQYRAEPPSLRPANKQPQPWNRKVLVASVSEARCRCPRFVGCIVGERQSLRAWSSFQFLLSHWSRVLLLRGIFSLVPLVDPKPSQGTRSYKMTTYSRLLNKRGETFYLFFQKIIDPQTLFKPNSRPR